MPYVPDGSKPYYLRLRISLLEGCREKYKGIYRTIDALSTNTLEDLHDEIFTLFERYDHHLWDFQFGGRRPNAPHALRFASEDTIDAEREYSDEADQIRLASEVTLANLNLSPKYFFYVFDYGDEWMHKITVSSYQEVKEDDPDEYRLVKAVGKIPPEYPDYDDEMMRRRATNYL